VPEQAAHVVALREALAAHQPTRFEGRVGEQEAVGGDEVDARVMRPAHQQRLQHARDRALPHRDAAREPDDVRDARVQVPEERLRRREQLSARVDAQAQQPAQRQVRSLHLVERDRLVAATQRFEFGGRQRELRAGAQARPFFAREVDVGGDVARVVLGHAIT
jgi:hypothetical protein